jgi:hypothetical protein
MRWTVRGSKNITVKMFRNVHTGFGTLPTFYSVCKRQDRQVNYSSLPSAEVKNEWNYTSIPPYMLPWRGQVKLYFYLLTCGQNNILFLQNGFHSLYFEILDDGCSQLLSNFNIINHRHDLVVLNPISSFCYYVQRFQDRSK